MVLSEQSTLLRFCANGSGSWPRKASLSFRSVNYRVERENAD